MRHPVTFEIKAGSPAFGSEARFLCAQFLPSLRARASSEAPAVPPTAGAFFACETARSGGLQNSNPPKSALADFGTIGTSAPSGLRHHQDHQDHQDFGTIRRVKSESGECIGNIQFRPPMADGDSPDPPCGL
jgi:hypothetical protein